MAGKASRWISGGSQTASSPAFAVVARPGLLLQEVIVILLGIVAALSRTLGLLGKFSTLALLLIVLRQPIAPQLLRSLRLLLTTPLLLLGLVPVRGAVEGAAGPIAALGSLPLLGGLRVVLALEVALRVAVEACDLERVVPGEALCFGGAVRPRRPLREVGKTVADGLGVLARVAENQAGIVGTVASQVPQFEETRQGLGTGCDLVARLVGLVARLVDPAARLVGLAARLVSSVATSLVARRPVVPVARLASSVARLASLIARRAAGFVARRAVDLVARPAGLVAKLATGCRAHVAAVPQVPLLAFGPQHFRK